MVHTATVQPQGWCAKLVQGWRNFRQLDSLMALDPRDRSRILAEAGITEQDLPSVMHATHVQHLLPAAMDLHGVDAEALDHDRADLMHDMQRACSCCRNTRACKALIAEGASPAQHAQVCPNAATLESLR